MNYIEAVKEVQSPKKQKENFLQITLSYDFTLILPHKDGLALLAALAHAEQMDNSYSSKKHILPLMRDKIIVSPMPHQDYERCKIAMMLGISISDLERLEEEELNKDSASPV